LGHYEAQIGYLAFWLSVVPILFVIYRLSRGKKIDQV
ncbi:DUF1405 domain-containing protein, partial [Staphylococcus pseudintermedius]